MTTERVERIKQILQNKLHPSDLQVVDEGHLHVGHAGAQKGGGHFNVSIVAEVFRDKTLVARHRIVYAALEDMLRNDIHALSIKANTLEEI